MAQVKTIGEAVRNMSVHMANMYYYLTKAVTLATRQKSPLNGPLLRLVMTEVKRLLSRF